MVTKTKTVEIGQTRNVPVNISTTQVIKIEVTIINRRKMFNRHEWLVVPTAGIGEAWMTNERVLSG